MNKLMLDIKKLFNKNTSVLNIILINGIVFVAILISQLIVNKIFNKNYYLINYLSLPSNLSELIYKPWTILSSLFVETSFYSLIFNLLGIYFIGFLLNDFFTKKQIWTVYLLGGIFSSLGFLFITNVILPYQNVEVNQILMGCSGSFYALLFAMAFYIPYYRVHILSIFKVKIIWIALILLSLDFVAIINSAIQNNFSGTTAQWVHFFGAFFGILYSRYKKGVLQIKLFEPVIKTERLSPPRHRITITKSAYKNITNETKLNIYSPSEDEINQILDKISTYGYDYLSSEEKELLKNAYKD